MHIFCLVFFSLSSIGYYIRNEYKGKKRKKKQENSKEYVIGCIVKMET